MHQPNSNDPIIHIPVVRGDDDRPAYAQGRIQMSDTRQGGNSGDVMEWLDSLVRGQEASANGGTGNQQVTVASASGTAQANQQAQNNTQNNAPNQNQSNQNQGGSRFGNRFGGNNNTQNNAPNQNQNNQPNQNNQNQGGSRFGNRFGGNNNAQNNAPNQNQSNQNQGGSRFASRFGGNNNQQASAPPAPNPFAVNQRRWTIQPLTKTMVRFELRGLGDPFFRLLGYPLNSEYGEFKHLMNAFQQGGDVVEELIARLNDEWARVPLDGAVMVYTYNHNVWNTVTNPYNEMINSDQNNAQQNQNNNNNPNTQNGFTDDFDIEPEVAKEIQPFVMYRALDMALTINVLARSRTQLLMTQSPPILNGEYLGRSLMTDDPRIVELVKATGYMEEG